MNYFIDVILPLPLDKHFVYSITDEEQEKLEPGMRVAIPFGKTKVYTGIVSKIHSEAPVVYTAKPIEQILDDLPLVTSGQLAFWKWMASYYMCAEGDILRAALPSAFLLESETVIEMLASVNIEEDTLKDDEFLIYQALQNQSLLKIKEVQQILDKKTVLPVINALVSKGIILVNQEINKRYKPKLVRHVRLANDYTQGDVLQDVLKELSNAPKQKEVVLAFFTLSAQKKEVSIKELKEKSGASSGVIKALIDKKIFEEFHEKTDRLASAKKQGQKQIQLSEEQQRAFGEIETVFSEKKVCLLHGVTSSGKTEVYIKLIAKTLKEGKQVLYLLPEIALTTQLITRLKAYFGEEVMVFHSKYSVNERVEVYRHVLNQTKGKVVIGARSAIFLPFPNLGLVVVDESHEATFKQYDPAPRYHARDAAVVLAMRSNANILLGSATPALESFSNAQQKKYGLVSLNSRYGNVRPPKIELVDIKEKSRKKRMTGHFSDTLLKAMEAALADHKQIILFQNRRGYSPILECNTCGHSPQCPNCDVSLTYHRRNNALRCHYCGYHIAMQTKCLACGSTEVTTKGFGTEQVENELMTLFPSHKIGRMDLDTTRGKYGYERIINAFEKGELDILVGTQMLTKGLDFRNVALVAVMKADSLLNFPDFRAHERSFQLLLQVAGRAGRTAEQGKVLIQTYNPYHRILQQVSTHDYVGMYHEQMDERHNFKYPPIYRLIKLSFKGRDYNKVNEAAGWFAESLRQTLKENVLGPEFPPVSRIRNEYYKNVMVKIPQKQSLVKTKDYLRKIISSYQSIGAYNRVRLIVNVDPV